MQNGREFQYCEFLEFFGRPMNFLGHRSSWDVTHATMRMHGMARARGHVLADVSRVREWRSGVFDLKRLDCMNG
eukprot:COSAG02_NODE_6968_length_3258_cov_19.611558_1_plen_74_part_00